MTIEANSVCSFCTAHGISRATFYNLKKRGEGPTIMKVGKRTLISEEAAKTGGGEWRQLGCRPKPSQTGHELVGVTLSERAGGWCSETASSFAFVSPSLHDEMLGFHSFEAARRMTVAVMARPPLERQIRDETPGVN
jgi:hypothetical protein